MLETLRFKSKMDRKCVVNKNLTMIYKWIKPPAYSFDVLSISYHHSYQRQFICFIQPFSYREFFTIHFLSCFCCWDVMTSLTKHCNHIFFIKIYYKDTVGKSVRLDSGGLGVRIPAVTDKVVTSPLLYARQWVRASRVLGDEHYKWIPRVTVGVAR